MILAAIGTYHRAKHEMCAPHLRVISRVQKLPSCFIYWTQTATHVRDIFAHFMARWYPLESVPNEAYNAMRSGWIMAWGSLTEKHLQTSRMLKNRIWIWWLEFCDPGPRPRCGANVRQKSCTGEGNLAIKCKTWDYNSIWQCDLYCKLFFMSRN